MSFDFLGDYSYDLHDKKHSRKLHYVEKILFDVNFKGNDEDGASIVFLKLMSPCPWDYNIRTSNLCTKEIIANIKKQGRLHKLNTEIQIILKEL